MEKEVSRSAQRMSCPFCRGLVGIDVEACIVTHTIPTCDEWQATDDALEFAVMMRKRLGLPDPVLN